MGFVVPIDAVAQELATENAAYAAIPAIADVTSQKGLEGVWRGVFVYAAFQCVSVPAMIAASTELTHKGVKRAQYPRLAHERRRARRFRRHAAALVPDPLHYQERWC